VSKTLTLTGAGADRTVTRALRVTDSGVATIKSLSITGSASDGIQNDGTLTLVASRVTDSYFAGIRNWGTATIKNTTISGNHAFGAYQACQPNAPCFFGGAGIFNAGALALSNSTVSDNRSMASGGGILSTGRLTLSASTVTRNVAFRGCIGSDGIPECTPGGAASGAGLAVFGGTATVSDSTISGNTAADDGGGIYVASGTVTIVSTTVAGNIAGLDGGGIINYGTSTLKRSSIAGNTAGGSGGGIANVDGGDIQLRGSTVTGNRALQGGGLASTSIAPVPVWMDSKTSITGNVPDDCWPISFGAGCAA
ncbi:hypothetical protein ACFQGU_17560, partial [Longivirga aurantiaca]